MYIGGIAKTILGCSSLVPSPTSCFSSLAVPYSKRRKAGRGTGNEDRDVAHDVCEMYM